MSGVDPEGLETQAAGPYVNATAFSRQVGGDAKIIGDDGGNVGLSITYRNGGSTDPFGISVGGSVTDSTA